MTNRYDEIEKMPSNDVRRLIAQKNDPPEILAFAKMELHWREQEENLKVTGKLITASENTATSTRRLVSATWALVVVTFLLSLASFFEIYKK